MDQKKVNLYNFEGFLWNSPEEGLGGGVITPVKGVNSGTKLTLGNKSIMLTELIAVMTGALSSYIKELRKMNEEPKGYSFDNL